MSEDRERYCDDCGIFIKHGEFHACSCGDTVCWECYEEGGHREHDDDPPEELP